MAKYRRLPVEVNAIQWTGQAEGEVMWFIGGSTQPTEEGLLLASRNGDLIAKEGDFIVRDEKGDISVYSPEVFRSEYEPSNVEALLTMKRILEKQIKDLMIKQDMPDVSYFPLTPKECKEQ